MNKKVTLLKVLFYYDVPQFILVGDENGNTYLCILFDDDNMLYSGIRISQSRLDTFFRGETDLRDLYLSPEDECFVIVSCEEDSFVITDRRLGVPEEEMLPDYGFELPSPLDKDEQELFADLAIYRHPIVKLGVSDANDSHTIPLTHLAELGSRYQRLVTNLQKKLQPCKDAPGASLMVYGVQAASFNLLMYVDSELELFFSPVDHTLSKIGELLSYESPETFRAKIEDLRGHALKSLREFIGFLVENDYTMKYRWMSNKESRAVYPKFDRVRLQTAYNILQETQEHEKVYGEVTGQITKASSVGSGEWTIRPSQGKPISGRSEPASMLEGVTINGEYRIKYEEIIKSDVVSVNDKIEKILVEISPISDK